MKYQYSHLEFVKTIPDVIWGQIPITAMELKIINNPLFTRLLEIKQMGCAWVAFPSAMHTRYQHSLGVMHVADQLLGLIKYKHNGDREEYLSENSVINQDVRQSLRLAGLLHDIGHPPFSHVIEEALRKNPDVISNNILEQNEFMRKLFEGNNYSHENATKYYLETLDINKIIQAEIGGKYLVDLPNLAVGEAKTYPLNLLNPIINSDLDADKIDYLKRDGYFCGYESSYDLNDFDSAMVIELLAENQSPAFFIRRQSIGIVSSFLQTRYRLISEYQHEEKSRISTQLLIDILVKQLKQITDQNKLAKVLEEIHLHFRDSELESIFTDPELKSKMESIRRSQIDYSEVKLKGLEKDEVLDFYDFTPRQRLLLQTILSFPSSITKVQKRIQDLTSDSDIILDIRTAKPPSFSMNVILRTDYRASIFYESDLAKGLLVDSIKNLKVYFYKGNTKKEETIDIDLPSFCRLVEECAFQAIDENLKTDKFIQGFFLVLFTIYSLCEYGENVLRINSPWVYSQFDFQFLLPKICEKLNIKNPYGEIPDKWMNSKCVRDFEILRTFGLIQERTNFVKYPYPKGNKDNLALNVLRTDYSLTSHGYEFCRSILKTSSEFSNLLKALQFEVENFENKYKDELVLFHQSESNIQLNRRNLSDSEDHGNQREEIRNKIRKNRDGCLLC